MVEQKKDLVNFIETNKMPLTGFTLIEGFPDLGLAGTIGTRYIVEKLNFEQIGFINSRLLLPILRISNGVPMHPVRIYANKKLKVVIVMAEQIIPNQVAHVFTESLVNWIKKKGIKRVIATSGIRVPNGKGVYAFASDEKSKKVITKNKIELIQNGVSSGITALLMLALKDNKMEAFCLLGNAKNNADYEAAAEIVKAFCKLTNICIDVKPLLKEAKKIEGAITAHLKTMQDKKTLQPSTTQSSGPTPMYA
ncbi:MAG: proteasome assembly chaperone family protein [Candidatus Diapherotrites archaeon]|nr:proteasome assembly chaperone family protein [Candidatus Diapherotrites archaeon]MBT4597126.1 proteasome assembly chaperone family protein [Candidatus Diapherotrites archaeon]